MAMSRFERFFSDISDASSFPLRFGQIDNEDQSGEGLGTGGPVLRVANMEFFIQRRGTKNGGGRAQPRGCTASRGEIGRHLGDKFLRMWNSSLEGKMQKRPFKSTWNYKSKKKPEKSAESQCRNGSLLPPHPFSFCLSRLFNLQGLAATKRICRRVGNSQDASWSCRSFSSQGLGSWNNRCTSVKVGGYLEDHPIEVSG